MSGMKKNSSSPYPFCEPNCSVHLTCTVSVWSFIISRCDQQASVALYQNVPTLYGWL